MKIYVSGTFTAQQRLRKEAQRLHEKGHEVVSSWVFEQQKPEHMDYDTWMLRLASKDVSEVFSADCVIMDLDEASTSGGRYVEWGVASHPLSMKRRLLVGGKAADGSALPYGCFNHLCDKYYPNWDALVEEFPNA